MSVEAPIYPADAAQVAIGPVESLPQDFFDGTVAVARGPVGDPETGYGSVIDIMSEGYAIERSPEPIATIVGPGPSPEDVLESMFESPDSEPRFVPYGRHMEDAGQDSTLAKGIALVSEQGVVKPVLTEEGQAEGAPEEKGGVAKTLLTALRRSRLGKVAAVTAIATGELLSIGTSSAQGADAQLEQECVQAGLKHPQIVKKGIKHAGQSGKAAGHNQTVFLVAHYDAMPEDCAGEYMRGNIAKTQFFINGKWRNRVPGWSALAGGVVRPGPGTSSSIDNQVAFNGTFYDLAGIHDKPWQLRPCRSRILLKEFVYKPKPRPEGDEPWDYSNPPIDNEVYTLGIPANNITPHSFRRNNC